MNRRRWAFLGNVGKRERVHLWMRADLMRMFTFASLRLHVRPNSAAGTDAAKGISILSTGLGVPAPSPVGQPRYASQSINNKKKKYSRIPSGLLRLYVVWYSCLRSTVNGTDEKKDMLRSARGRCLASLVVPFDLDLDARRGTTVVVRAFAYIIFFTICQSPRSTALKSVLSGFSALNSTVIKKM